MQSHTELVKKFYELFKVHDMQSYMQMCDESIEWKVMDGMPEGGTFVGKTAAFDGYFPKMLSHFEEFHAVPEQFFESGHSVIVLGRYTGVGKATGKSFESPFAHIYTIKDSRIVRFRQYADTKAIHDALR